MYDRITKAVNEKNEAQEKTSLIKDIITDIEIFDLEQLKIFQKEIAEIQEKYR